MRAPRSQFNSPGAPPHGPGARINTARRAALLALAGVAFVAAPARAQDNAVQVLPPWLVVEITDHTQLAAHSDTFASTLGPASVVSGVDWSGRDVATLAEALRTAPGVILQESFGGFEPPRLSIRGSGLDSAPTSRGVALLVDGLPLARADGSFHTGLFDPLLFSRVEVYRGTMHMALTPAELGGVLNAVSLAPDAVLSPVVRVAAGDFDAVRAQLSAGANRDATTVLAATSYDSARGWRDHSTQDRSALDATLRHDFSPTTQLDFSTYLATASYDVPGPLTLSDAQARPRSDSAAVIRDQPRRDSSVARLASQFKTDPPDGPVAFGLAAQQLRDDFYQLQSNGETASTSNDLSGHATVERHFDLGAVEHHLLARATFSTGVSSIDRYLNVSGQRGARFAAYDARADTDALSLEDLAWINPHLAAGLGFTALDAQRELDDRFTTADTPASLSRTLNFHDLSPRAGLTWEPRPDLAFDAAVSRGVEPPTFDDLVSVAGTYPNLALTSHALAQQEATTYEIGTRGRAGSLSWNVTLYHALWRHEILHLADASGQPLGTVNAQRTIHEGVESTLHWRLLEGTHRLTLSATTTLGHFYFDDDPVYGRNRIAGAPPLSGHGDLLYESPQHVFAAVGAEWTAGRTPVDHAGRLTYGGSGICDARLGWSPTPRFRIFATARNLFDRTTIASTAGVLDVARNPPATAIFLPGPGRGFTLGCEWKL